MNPFSGSTGHPAAVALLAAFLALGPGPAPAQSAAPADRKPAQPAPDRSDLSVFREGLASAMRDSAMGLANGKRHVATEALNRARHLANATAAAVGLDPRSGEVVGEARAAVRDGRSALQNGRPDETREILLSGAETLEKAQIGGDAAAVPPRSLAKAEGRTAINAKGETLGEFEGLEPAAGGPPAIRLSVGGFLGWGARSVTIPADTFLLGSHYVAVATQKTASDLKSE
jgi:hypothetical protein